MGNAPLLKSQVAATTSVTAPVESNQQYWFGIHGAAVVVGATVAVVVEVVVGATVVVVGAAVVVV